mgnify:CR=1 FL=1
MEYGALMEMAVRAGGDHAGERSGGLPCGGHDSPYFKAFRDCTGRCVCRDDGDRGDDCGCIASAAYLGKTGGKPGNEFEPHLSGKQCFKGICSGKLSVGEAQERLDRIANTTLYGFWKKCIGYAATTGFFAVMFGGGPGECLVAAVVGVVLAFVLRAASNLMLNDFCQNALGSFALAVAAYLLRRGAFLGMSLDVVIISAIMPLVPGVTFTAAIRDTLNGDYSSGVARMAEAVVVALAVASGVGLAIVAVRLAGGSV